MMEGVTLSHQYNYQQLRKKYSNGRSNFDQIDSKSQRQQEQEDLTEDINDIELGRAFDLNALESRLSDCFGHMRNDFEGEYICEKQGPMFGNYGSFLPIREHNPQTPKQVNSSVLLHNYSSQTTASERAVEKAPRLAITDGPWRRGSIAWRNPSLNDNTLHEFTKENLALNDTKVDGILPVEKMTANGVKLRFKCSSDIIRHPKNTAIYTDLGLQNSSSTSLEESLDKGQMVTTEVDSPPDMSPLSIIQIMTSYEVPGGSLLSPLPERLMEGQGKEDLSSKVIKRTSGKLQVNEACLANSIGFECGKGIQAPLPKEDTTASIFESKKEQYSEFRGEKVKKVKTDTGTKFRLSKASDPLVSKDSSKLSIKKLHQGKPEMGIAHDVETNIHRVRSLIPEEPNNLTNGKDFSSCPKSGNLETAAAQHPGRLTKTGKGLMPGGAKESHKMEREDQKTETRKENGHKDVADVRKINKSFKEVNKLGLSGASTYKGKNVLDDENKGVPKGKVLRHVATHEKVVVNTEHVKDMDMENKKTNNVNIYQKTMKEESKVVTKYKFKESLIEKSWVSKGQKEQSKKNSKDLHGKSAKCMNEQIVCKKEISMAHCKESTKQARHKHFDREISMGIERGKRRDVANEHDSKKLEHASIIKAHASKVETQSLLEQSATQGPATGTSDVDDWVYCDACGKWRLCPIGVKISPLPKKWLCHMMFWLPSMNHCDVLEEETTKAVYNLNAISQTQVLSETSQGKGQLPASVSTAILDPKPSNQIWPKSLQSSTKIGSNKKGLVQRNMPNVSGTVKFSNSFAGKDEHFPVNKKSDRYERHMEREEGAIDFSSCDDGGKSNGVINQKNKVKDKVKLKETFGGEACETEVVHAHTLNVKRKMDTELKECKSAKKLKAKEDLERNIERALVSPNMEHQSSMANAALQEGRDLEQKADRLKNNGGDELGVIGFYFRASLKFLQSASILEPLNADSVRHQENTSLALFAYAARLSEGCAKVYEQNGMWAAATLAYQCTGVARMHVVMGKTVSISKDRQELQSAAVLVPTGESPRSSASDVDNLNCHALTVVNQEKGLASLHASGNYVIDTKHCQHYNRLLQFVDDTNAAFKAFAKANSAFAAASDSSYREQEISVVKKAINLNFHNLDGLLRLVIPAMESTSLC